MPTLRTDTLSLQITHLDRSDHEVGMSLGLYCNGVPLLAGVHHPHHGHLPPGHVWVDDEADPEVDMVAQLRPAMADQRPRLWMDQEYHAHLLLYPPTYMRALHPVHMIPWEDTWPELAKDLEEGWRQRANGSQGTPLPDPAHRRPVPEGVHYLLQVCIHPRALGLPGGGHIMLELHPVEAELAGFFDALAVERKAFLAGGA